MANGTTRTIWDIRPGEQLMLDGRRILVELVEKSGKLARLRVTAPRDVKIEREERGPRAMRDSMPA